MSKTLKWLLGILIALILISLGFWGGKLYFDKKNEKETSSSTPATTESTTKDNTATEEQAQNGAGWKIFKNLASGEWLEYGISVNEKMTQQ